MSVSKLIKDNIIHSPIPDCPVPQCDVWTLIDGKRIDEEWRSNLDNNLTNESITCKDFYDKAGRIAAIMTTQGFQKENLVCIYMVNSIEALLFITATWRLGGTVAIINPMLSVREVTETLHNLAPKFLICDSFNAKTALEASKNTTVQKLVIRGSHTDCIPISEYYEPENNNLPIPRVSINPEKDVALILYSSGTTDLPKAVQLTHRAVVTTYASFIAPENDLTCVNAVIFQPLAHMFGLMACYIQISMGRRIILLPITGKFNVETYIKLVSEYKCEQLYLIPMIAVALTKGNLLQKYDLSHVRTVFCGSSPLPQSVEEEMISIFGKHCQVRLGYSLTESSARGTFTPSKHIYPDYHCPRGSVGLPMSRVLVKVIDTKTSAKLPPNKPGEILFKTDHMMKGYRNNEKETSNMFDNEGWLYSGDFGYYDENGYLFIVDRLKDLIIYNGYRVAPCELEEILLRIPGIADCGVSSIPDEDCGDLPLAWIVAKSNATLSEEEIHQFVNDKVAPYKRLTGGVKFVDQIPKSATGKILRREIRKLAQLSE